MNEYGIYIGIAVILGGLAIARLVGLHERKHRKKTCAFCLEEYAPGKYGDFCSYTCRDLYKKKIRDLKKELYGGPQNGNTKADRNDRPGRASGYYRNIRHDVCSGGNSKRDDQAADAPKAQPEAER